MVGEAEHLPDRKTKSDADLAIEELESRMTEIYPNLDRQEFREQIKSCVQEYVPDEGEGADDEESGAGVMGKAKGLAKQATGAVTRNKEMKAEGRLEREGSAVEGNKAYFRSAIEETNQRAADRT